MADGKVKKEKQYRDAKFPKGLKTVDAKEAAHYSGNQIYVKDIYIPASVERITKDAFTVLRGMTGSFIVDPDNPLYSSFGKAILSKNGKRFLHCVMSYKEGRNVIVIPDGVEIIEEYAFSSYGSENSAFLPTPYTMLIIVMPPSVQEIAERFYLSMWSF